MSLLIHIEVDGRLTLLPYQSGATEKTVAGKEAEVTWAGKEAEVAAAHVVSCKIYSY